MEVIYDSDAVSSSANTIKQEMDKIRNTYLTQIKTDIASIDSSWEGDAKETAMTNLNTFITDLEKWLGVIDTYSAYVSEYLNGWNMMNDDYAKVSIKTK